MDYDFYFVAKNYIYNTYKNISYLIKKCSKTLEKKSTDELDSFVTQNFRYII